MNRATNFSLTEADIISKCAAAKVAISVIEVLPRGGTRLVCTTEDGAEIMRRQLASHILDGTQQRVPFFVPTLQR